MAVLWTMLWALSAYAQDLDTAGRALRPSDTQAAQQAVLDELEQRAKAALDAIPHARSKADAERMRPELRRKLTESLGLSRLGKTRSAGRLLRQSVRLAPTRAGNWARLFVNLARGLSPRSAAKA